MANLTFNFPARMDEIQNCNNVEQLKEWQKAFDEELTKAEFTFGEDFCEANPKLRGFLQANEKNLKSIKWKIGILTKPVSPERALRMFNDVTRMMVGESIYQDIVKMTLDKLGRPDEDFKKMIEPKPKPNFKKR